MATKHALATNLVGFAASTLRVIVLEERDGFVWVVTADLLDVGTKLTLDASQIVSLPVSSSDMRHVAGLVSFGGAR